MRTFCLTFIISLALLISSCEEGVEYEAELNNPSSQLKSDTIKFAQVKTLFNSYGCITCHSGDFIFGDFDLDVPLTDLINLKSNFSDNNIISPGDPEESALYLALLGEGGMTKMPQNGQMDSEDIDIIKKWIEQGALEN